MSHADADADCCPGGAGVDHISDLPDHLLHDVLVRLPGTAAAARTSILSRRWRRVWTHLPVLRLDFSSLRWASAMGRIDAAGAMDRIDAALAAHAATVSLLEIVMPTASPVPIPMDRVSAWLLVASQRLTGKLLIELPYHNRASCKDEVLLPICERATSMNFNLKMRVLRFPLPQHAGGVFKALATLKIFLARIDGGELEAALSSRCPRLKELVLNSITLQDAGRDLSIRSESLVRLQISFVQQFDGRLHVDAPKLRIFHPNIAADFCVLAPKLSEVIWGSSDYDSTRHHLALAAGHQLRRLEVKAGSPGSALMRQFNTVYELDLTVYLPKGSEKYERFLEYTGKLAKCEVLLVRFVGRVEHGFQPAMLHLLRKCAGVRRLVVELSYKMNDYPCKLSSGCPCSRPESCKAQDVVLDSLEEVVIKGHGGADHKVELVRILRRCSTTFSKRVAITVLERRGYWMDSLRKKIQGIICRPKDKVEIVLRAT